MGHAGRFGGEKRGTGVSVATAVGDEVAYVRARFAVDPSTPTRFADAWTAPMGAIEEDESELIDAVADCLSVGLPIDAAVASWRSGSLQITNHDSDDDEDDTDVYDDDAETGVYDLNRPVKRRVEPARQGLRGHVAVVPVTVAPTGCVSWMRWPAGQLAEDICVQHGTALGVAAQAGNGTSWAPPAPMTWSTNVH